MAEDGCWMLFVVHYFFIVRLNPVFAEFTSYTQILAARQLYVYSSFKDVQIFHYRVPPEVLTAKWTFFANESSGCTPKNVSMFLQYGSYPVVNPDNSSLPPNFFIKRTSLHNISLMSDSSLTVFSLSEPAPGDWFLIAFLVDRNDKIQQKGLFTKCTTSLSSTLKFHRFTNIVQLLPGVSLAQQIEQMQYYKFYVPPNTWSVTITLKNCAGVPILTEVACLLVMAATPLSLPSLLSSDHFVNCSIQYQGGHQCILEFVPYEDAWHYVLLDVVSTKMEFQLTVETTVCENGGTPKQYLILSELKFPNATNLGSKAVLKVPNAAKRILVPLPFTVRTKASSAVQICWPQVPLMRNTTAGNFKFEYVPETTAENNTVPAKLDLSNTIPTLLAFPVRPLLDIGGTLIFELGIDISVNTTVQNVSVTACLERGTRPVVLGSGNCSSGVSIQVNTSSEAGRGNLIMVPYPEPGTWYVSLQSSCYHLDPATSEHMVVVCDANKTAIAFRILSDTCLYSGCGPYGVCYQYISGGFIFSTCVCIAGWRGWGCTDNSHALNEQELLMATLLLTLSNLLFLPTIILAVYRHYYTEALVYFFTMFFSTFYHACDEDVYTYCLMPLSVMQFCDFYSAILSFWVTLIAMADLPTKLISLAHMAGALGVAVGVEFDRTGLWVFVVPSCTGVLIMISSWIYHCYKRRSCFPKTKIWLVCLFPGVLLAATGLVCFAFLETHDNYKYVHSGWHAAMALAVLFLLPPRRKHKGRQRSDCNSSNSISYLKADELLGLQPAEHDISTHLLPESELYR